MPMPSSFIVLATYPKTRQPVALAYCRTEPRALNVAIDSMYEHAGRGSEFQVWVLNPDGTLLYADGNITARHGVTA